MATQLVAFFRAKKKSDPDSKSWEEDTVLRQEDLQNPEKACLELFQHWNDTCEPGEEREFLELLRVEEIGEEDFDRVIDFDNDEDFFFDEDEDEY